MIIQQRTKQQHLYSTWKAGLYEQVGLDVDGEAAGDWFGTSVSLSADGTTFVVGAPFNDGSRKRKDSGHVRVYKLSGNVNGYTQVGSDINGEAKADYSGYSVSISADSTTFAVGAYKNDGNRGPYYNSGHVRVYKYKSNMSSYAQLGSDIDNSEAYGHFGWSVSISADGSTLVVGTPWNGDYDGSGYVRVYKYNSTINNYAKIGLDIHGEKAYDEFGYSVSISADGSTFVVGAKSHSGNGRYSGQVRVYKYDSTIQNYAQVGLDIHGEVSADNFGFSVSISADGSTFVAGAPRTDSSGDGSGYVHVYKYNSTIESYTQVGLNVYGEAAGDNFGYSVSISADGSTFVVGATHGRVFRRLIYNDAPVKDSGHVRVFKLNSSFDSYVQVGLAIAGEGVGDCFGKSVSISADGTIFVVGAPYNGSNGFQAGHVRVYKFNSSSVNNSAQVIAASAGEVAFDVFGSDTMKALLIFI